MKYRGFVLAAVAIAALGIAVIVGLHAQPPPEAVSLKEKGLAAGLHYHCGNAAGEDRGVFFLSDHPIALEDVVVLNPTDCSSPRWRGVIWVESLKRIDGMNMQRGGVDGKARVIGDYLVAGDQSLIDHLEAIAR